MSFLSRARVRDKLQQESGLLKANMVIAVGNCGLYAGPWGVRVEDTVWVGSEGPKILTRLPRHLQK